MSINNNQSLNIFLLNANGIIQHVNVLQIVLNKKTLIAFISETHLTKSSTLKIFGYETIIADHPNRTAHSGAALIISNKIVHHPHPVYTSMNLQAASTEIVINSVPISISSSYSPPSRPFSVVELAIFLRSLSFTYEIGF